MYIKLHGDHVRLRYGAVAGRGIALDQRQVRAGRLRIAAQQTIRDLLHRLSLYAADRRSLREQDEEQPEQSLSKNSGESDALAAQHPAGCGRVMIG